jgi:hypothetical protein
VNGDLLGIGSLLVAGVAWALWLRRVQAVAVPRDRRAFLLAAGSAVALGIGAFSAGTGHLGAVAAGLGIFSGAVYLALRLQSRQDARAPAVKVGEPMPAFDAPDEAGARFDSASLAGRPYLLKFFRGHW